MRIKLSVCLSVSQPAECVNVLTPCEVCVCVGVCVCVCVCVCVGCNAHTPCDSTKGDKAAEWFICIFVEHKHRRCKIISLPTNLPFMGSALIAAKRAEAALSGCASAVRTNIGGMLLPRKQLLFGHTQVLCVFIKYAEGWAGWPGPTPP